MSPFANLQALSSSKVQIDCAARLLTLGTVRKIVPENDHVPFLVHNGLLSLVDLPLWVELLSESILQSSGKI